MSTQGSNAKAQITQAQIMIPATYMRGGTSKGVFFRLQDLPEWAREPGPARDALLMRVIGSPDPYGKHTDGMGGATSSTSKCVLVSPSQQPGHDVDYLYGQIGIEDALVDWSGNCGNLSAAVGPFAITGGLIPSERIPEHGVVTVRIWQANIGKTILAHIPICHGRVQELGDFELDGVTFPAAEIALEFLDPAPEGDDGASAMFPTGEIVELLEVPGLGKISVTMIAAGIPTVFLNAADVGLTGSELQTDVNGDAALLARLELIRAHAAVRMGLIKNTSEAAARQHTPKIAMVAAPETYRASSGRMVDREAMDLRVRALSMGKLHHAMMATCAVAIATAASVPGTVVHAAAGGGPGRESIRFGHPSGTLRVGACAEFVAGEWRVTKALMSRSARVLMHGWVHVPDPACESV